MRPSRVGPQAAALLTAAAFSVPATVPAASATTVQVYEHIEPGEQVKLRDDMPVNYVFVGYEQDLIDKSVFLAALPRESRPLARVPNYQYSKSNYIGIRHVFDHRVTFTDEEYEDRFFNKLADLARPAPLSLWQTNYNAQEARTATVENNHLIRAPAVERWLANNPPEGVDTSDHTVFFINWYGREDFRFHVYEKTGEPMDFGIDAGEREDYFGIAWGGSSGDDPETGLGSTHRIWFHDLSAGPERMTMNWDITNTDLNGDGDEDYRMPPMWEYAEDGYRPLEKLTSDLAKIARYVAIDILFAPSPLYTPAIEAPRLARSVNLDMNFYDGAPHSDTSEEWIDEEQVRRSIARLLPDREVTVDKEDLDIHAPEHARCFLTFLLPSSDIPNCFAPEHPSYGRIANLFLYGVKNLDLIFDDEAHVDYEAGSFSYWLPDYGTADCWGIAGDNYSDGAQSFVYVFLEDSCNSPNPLRPALNEFQPCPGCYWRTGYTWFLTHEYGHHFGMSHTHDGYDYEKRIDFRPANAYHFAWIGDEVNSPMSYLRYNNDFSQFELDNMTRWLTAAYLTATNEIAAELPESESDAIEATDQVFGTAKASFSSRAYGEALEHAIRAHEMLVAAALRAGIEVPNRWTGHTLVDENTAPPDIGSPLDRPGAYMYVDDLSSMGPGRLPREARSNASAAPERVSGPWLSRSRNS